jgi:hypothetical protein
MSGTRSEQQVIEASGTTDELNYFSTVSTETRQWQLSVERTQEQTEKKSSGYEYDNVPHNNTDDEQTQKNGEAPVIFASPTRLPHSQSKKPLPPFMMKTEEFPRVNEESDGVNTNTFSGPISLSTPLKESTHPQVHAYSTPAPSSSSAQKCQNCGQISTQSSSSPNEDMSDICTICLSPLRCAIKPTPDEKKTIETKCHVRIINDALNN